jgi:hypothetical protein
MEQNDGSTAESTDVLGLRSRHRVKAHRLNADPGRGHACIITARGNSSPVSM